MLFCSPFPFPGCYASPRTPTILVFMGQLIDSASTHTMGERKTNRSSNTNNNACHKGSGFRVISISGLFVSRNLASRFAWRHLSGFGFWFLFPDRDIAPLGKVPITSSLCFLGGGGVVVQVVFCRTHMCCSIGLFWPLQDAGSKGSWNSHGVTCFIF